jgi:hypothetical protein
MGRLLFWAAIRSIRFGFFPLEITHYSLDLR